MFAIKTTIDEEMMKYIRETKAPKEVWDTFKALFARKKDMRVQLLENELLSVK